MRSVKKLSLPLQSMNMETLKMYKHLQHLPIQEYENAVPRILIGLDNANLTTLLKIREGLPNDLIAAKTRLGSTVFGDNKSDELSENRLTHQTYHICECTDDTLHELVKTHFALDSLPINKPESLLESRQEKRAREIMECTSVRRDGYFETILFWKDENSKLPDNLPLAKQRLNCLEKKMEFNEEFKFKMQELIQDYIKKGYVRKLTPAEVKSTHP